MLSPVKLWRNQKNIRELVGRVGTIVSLTYIRVPPAKFADQAPYIVGLINFGKFNYIGQIVDTDHNLVKIGQQVVTVARRVRQPDPEGVIPYGIKFKLSNNPINK